MTARAELPTAEALRASFDAAFAEAHVPAPEVVDLLAIRIAEQPYALRLAQVAGLYADRAITPLPSRRADVLGLAGFRGLVVPVFDLARLLGHPAVRQPRWLVTVARAPVALAFATFDGHLRVTRDAIVTRDATAEATPVDVVRDHGPLRPLLDLERLVGALAAPVGKEAT